MIKVFVRFFAPMILLLLMVFYFINMLEKNHQRETAIIQGESQVKVWETNILNIVAPLVANNMYLSRSRLLHLDLSDSTNREKVLVDLLHFARVFRYFEQVRVLDAIGEESLRINAFGDSIEVVSEEDLQNKKGRSYFKMAEALAPEEFYISPIELNREHDSIYRPYHAVVRIISAISSDAGDRRLGYFVTNISVENLVESLVTGETSDTAQLLILNYRGEGVYKQAKDMGYKFSDISPSSSLGDSHPALWAEIRNNETGQVSFDNGIYVYKKLDLVNELSHAGALRGIDFIRPDHSELILISFIPFSNKGFFQGIAFEDQTLLLFLLLVLLVGAIMLTYRKLREEKMYSEIIDLNEELIESQYALNRDRVKLENTVKELSRRNTQLKEFSHIISHNIRSPISGLTLLVDFLSQDQMYLSEKEKREVIEKLVLSTETLNKLTEDLMETVSILDEGEINMEEISLLAVIDRSKDMLTDKILERNTIIKTDMNAWSSIIYNKLYLESIVLNILSNAIKYHDPGRALEINIYTEIVDERKVLKISDNGRGINMEWHGQNVFGLHKTFHRDVPGKGFGLFMTKTQIQSLGGEISVESEEGVGSTFIIVF